MTSHDPHAFANQWIVSWNSHDLDRILSHYAADVVLLSPVAEKLVGNGRIIGLQALRGYWGPALKGQPELKFDLIKVLAGYQCLTILYQNHRGQTVAETCEFDDNGKVARSFACYALPVPGAATE